MLVLLSASHFANIVLSILSALMGAFMLTILLKTIKSILSETSDKEVE